MAIVLPMIFMLLLGIAIGIWIINPIVRNHLMFADTPRKAGINISATGKDICAVDDNGNQKHYVLSTPWDLTTITVRTD